MHLREAAVVVPWRVRIGRLQIEVVWYMMDAWCVAELQRRGVAVVMFGNLNSERGTDSPAWLAAVTHIYIAVAVTHIYIAVAHAALMHLPRPLPHDREYVPCTT